MLFNATFNNISGNVAHLALIEIRTHNFTADNQPAYNHYHDGHNVIMKNYSSIHDHII